MIILLIGRSRVGKDTFANTIECERFAFADRLKQVTKDFLEFLTGKHVPLYLMYDDKTEVIAGKTIRRWLQYIGTDMFRAVDDEIWLKQFKQTNSLQIITDSRFENELVYFKKHFGNVVTVKITRDDAPKNEYENHIDDIKTDYTIENNGTLDEYENKCKQLIKQLII